MNETKEKRELLERIYDKLYLEAEAILKEFNPCEHKVVKGVHSCIGQKPHTGNDNPQCCCVGCPMWDKGCKAEKPLTCKSWLCMTAENKHPKIAEKLGLLMNKVVKFNFYVYRGDKSKSMNQAINQLNSISLQSLENELIISNL